MSSFSVLLLSPLIVTLSASAAAPAPVPGGGAGKPKILVYELRSDGVDDATLRLIRDSLTTELARDARVDVVSVEEMRRVLALEADKSAVGCDVASAACQAEIAQALGARYLVIGNVGKLGALTVVNLALTDTTLAQPVARAKIEVRALEDVAPELRAVSTKLVDAISGRPAGAGGLPLVPIVVTGGGAALGIGALALGVIANGAVGDVARDPVERRDSERSRNVAYVVAGVGALCAAVGGALLALEVM